MLASAQPPPPGQLPPELLQWLYRVLTPEYADPNAVYRDAVQLLSSYTSLRPRTSVYTDETGRPELLLCVHGLLPTQIGQAVYRIPIEVWVPKQYPRDPPFAFVRPTQSMMIHPGNYVDTNGRCYHPYLSYWSDNDSASVVGFVDVLRDAFGKETPVYASPAPAYSAGAANQPASNQSGLNQPGSPSQAGPSAQPLSQTPLSPRSPPGVPAPPPKVPMPQMPRYLYMDEFTSGSPQSQPTPQPGYTSPGYSSPGFAHPGLYANGSNRSSIHENGPPLPPHPPQSPREVHIPQPQYGASPYGVSPQQPQYGASPQQPQYGASPPVHHLAHTARPPAGPPPGYARPVVDLMNSDDRPLSPPDHSPGPGGPAPQRPPNPERLQALEKLSQQLNAMLESELKPELQLDENALAQTRSVLEWMDRAIERETWELTTLQTSSIESEKTLRDSIETARKVIADAAHRPDVNIDDVVCGENIVYNQLYDVVSEDQAIDDTLYMLDKALDAGRIKMEAYLKHSRALAREQFMKRALANKIALTAGLQL